MEVAFVMQVKCTIVVCELIVIAFNYAAWQKLTALELHDNMWSRKQRDIKINVIFSWAKY